MFQQNKSLNGDPNMLLSIEYLGLPKMALTALQRRAERGLKEVYFLGELLALSIEELKSTKGFGGVALESLVEVLSNKGYKLCEAAPYAQHLSFCGEDGEKDVRGAFDIAETVNVPLDWIKVEGRGPVYVPTKEHGGLFTKQFSTAVFVPVPYEMRDPAKVRAIRQFCQKAFEKAIDLAWDVAKDPTRQVNLQEALRPDYKFDGNINYKNEATIRADVTLTEAMTAFVDAARARQIARSLEGDVLKGFIFQLLKAKEPF